MYSLLLQWPGPVMLAAPVLAGFFDFLKSRKKEEAPPQGKPAPMFPPMEPGGEPQGAAGTAAADGPGAGKRDHLAPKIVATYGPPPPAVKPLEPERREELPGAQPRVAKVASEEEEEEGEIEDMAREAIESCRLMLVSLAEGGMDVAVAERQLSMAESMFQQGHYPEAVNYASKAMDLAEDLEADRDRCPKCHAETKPRWLLCPKCGQPLR
jgi:hypothetical protein